MSAGIPEIRWDDVFVAGDSSKLHAGSYAVVYAGTYAGKQVAVKHLDLAVIGSSRRQSLLDVALREAKVQAACNGSSFTVDLIGYAVKRDAGGVIDGVRFVMSLGCCSLGDVVEKGDLSAAQRVSLALQTARCVSFLHGRGVIHKDLKPQNAILFDGSGASPAGAAPDAGSLVVRVGDFGQAVVRSATGTVVSRTTGGAWGTPEYAPPESVEGKPAVAGSDVWSLGMIVFSLLARSASPWRGVKPDAADFGFFMATKVLAGDVRPDLTQLDASLRATGVHDRLAAVLTRCWQLNSADRPAAAEVVAVLEEVARAVGSPAPVPAAAATATGAAAGGAGGAGAFAGIGHLAAHYMAHPSSLPDPTPHRPTTPPAARRTVIAVANAAAAPAPAPSYVPASAPAPAHVPAAAPAHVPASGYAFTGGVMGAAGAAPAFPSVAPGAGTHAGGLFPTSTPAASGDRLTAGFAASAAAAVTGGAGLFGTGGGRTAARKGPSAQVLDIAFLMDCTGSMEPHIEKCKAKVVEISSKIVSSMPGTSIKIAFVGYRDFDYGAGHFAICPFKDATDVQAFIAGVDMGSPSNNDRAEDVTGGVRQALDLKWRSPAARLIIHFGDMPAHGRAYHDCEAVVAGDAWDNYIDMSDKEDGQLEPLMRQLANKKIDYYFMRLTHHTDKMTRAMKAAYDGAGTANREFTVVPDMAAADPAMFVAKVVDCVTASLSATKGAY